MLIAYEATKVEVQETLHKYLEESMEMKARIFSNVKSIGTAGSPFGRKQFNELRPSLDEAARYLTWSLPTERRCEEVLFKATMVQFVTLLTIHANLNSISYQESMDDFRLKVKI